MYASILDFVYGTLLAYAIFRVPKVKKALAGAKAYNYREKYARKCITAYSLWASLLFLTMLLAFIQHTIPQIYNTTHIAQLVSGLIQICNTLQFFAAFEFMRGIELLMKIAANRLEVTATSGDNSIPLTNEAPSSQRAKPTTKSTGPSTENSESQSRKESSRDSAQGVVQGSDIRSESEDEYQDPREYWQGGQVYFTKLKGGEDSYSEGFNSLGDSM